MVEQRADDGAAARAKHKLGMFLKELPGARGSLLLALQVLEFQQAVSDN